MVLVSILLTHYWLVKNQLFHLFLGLIAKFKWVVRKNWDFMQMRLFQYCNVIGCGGEYKHIQMRFGCATVIIG